MKQHRAVYSLLATTIAIAALSSAANAQTPVLRIATLTVAAPLQDADALYNQGVDLQQAGKFEEAIKKYDEAVKKRAVFPDAWLNRGICYLALEKWDPAIENFNLYIQRKPDVAAGYINRATAYSGKKQYAEALKDYEMAVTKRPKADDMAVIYLNRGNAYFSMGDFDKAIADYNEVLKAPKPNPVVYLNRGNAHMNKASKARDAKNEAAAKTSADAAAADFAAYIRLAPNDPEGYLARAEANVNAKNFAPVVDDVTKYYSLNGTDPAGYAFRAQAYLGMTPPKVAEASADIEKAIAKDPSNPAYAGLFIQLANARVEAKDYKGAIDVANRLLAIPSQAKNMNALRIRAYSNIQLGAGTPPDAAANTAAINDYNVIIAANPKDDKAIQNRAVAYYRLKQYDKAAADADLWIQVAPDNVEAYNLKGLSLLSMTPPKYDQAIAVYTRVIEKKPADAAARYNRGLAYYNMKQYDKALPDLEEAAKDPKLPQAKDIPGMIATAYISLGKIDDAIAKLRQQVANNPTDGEAHLSLAALLYQKADKMPDGDAKKQAYSATLPSYAKAAELLKNDPDPFTGRALVYLKLGQWDNSIKDATESLRIKPKNPDALIIRADAYYNKANAANPKDKTTAGLAVADYQAYLTVPGLKPEQMDDANEGLRQAAVVAGNTAVATQAFEAAIRKNPKDTNALKGRGILFYNNKQYDQALADFNSFITAKQDDPQVYYLRGLSYKAKGDNAKALADYEKSFSLKPDFAVGNATGELYLAAGDALYKGDPSDPDKAFDMYDKAALIFDKAAAAAPSGNVPPTKVADTYFNKGLALAKKADMCEFKTQPTPAGPIYQQAVAAYQKYLELNPAATDKAKVQEQINLLKEKAS